MKKAVLVLIFLILSLFSYSGYLIEESLNGEDSKVYIQGNIMKSVQDEMNFILDLKKETITFYSDKDSTYWVGKISELNTKLLKSFDMVIANIDNLLLEIPEDYRATYKVMIETNLKGMRTKFANVSSKRQGNFTIKYISKGEKVASYETKKYSVYSGNKKIKDVWVAEGVKLSKEINLNLLQKLMSEISLFNFEEGYNSSYEVKDFWSKGLPVKVVDYIDSNDDMKKGMQALGLNENDADVQNGMMALFGAAEGEIKTELSTNIINIEKRKFSKAELSVPSSYKKVDINNLFNLLFPLNDE